MNKDIFSVSRGMVGIMSDTKGVDIWVNFTETENGVLCEVLSRPYSIDLISEYLLPRGASGLKFDPDGVFTAPGKIDELYQSMPPFVRKHRRNVHRSDPLRYLHAVRSHRNHHHRRHRSR